MECRLSGSQHPWQCQISLRLEFDTSGERKDEIREFLFGPVIFNSDDVELAIRRAQAAILNPTIDFKRFLELPEDDVRSGKKVDGREPLSFSKNIVCLDISGPDVTDLAFVDLPGEAQPLIIRH
jgi:hypothetical protein